MRYHWLVLTILLVGTTTASSQQPPGPAPAPDRLDAFLQSWEKQMQSVQTLVAQCKRTDKDAVFQKTDVYVGVAKFMKPKLASLDMRREDGAGFPEKFICTGTYLYQFRYEPKELHVHDLPASKSGQVVDDGVLAFLFGMQAAEARKRFDLKLVKDDQYYVYVEILPRNETDKAEFQKARLVLNTDSFLPRQFWYQQANGSEVTWDIPRIEKNVRLERREFEAPATPPGWKQVRVPRPQADAPPRVYRPNQ